jgi:molybdopterin-binding protein
MRIRQRRSVGWIPRATISSRCRCHMSSPEPLIDDGAHAHDDAQAPDGVKIGAAAAALGVSVDTLRRWERNGRVTFERRGNQRYISSRDLAQLLRERGATGVSSARNRLQGTIIAVKKDGVMAQIEMACGPYRIVSLMSREAADELDLKPGGQAVAIVKSTTVIIETR